jgi:glycosyltransferase involved in cell wall biosynthesis
MKHLSILIPTLPLRIDSYASLIKNISNQIKKNNLEDKVQILTFLDTKELSVGEKRNILLRSSIGKYICFIDDDDIISEDYLQEIFNAIPHDADCITFLGEYIEQGFKKDFVISTMNRDNYNEPNCFYRLPNHLCPVKREIALSSLFSNKNYGEDSDYASKINKYIKTEYHIRKKLYFYMYDDAKSQTSPTNANKKIY